MKKSKCIAPLLAVALVAAACGGDDDDDAGGGGGADTPSTQAPAPATEPADEPGDDTAPVTEAPDDTDAPTTEPSDDGEPEETTAPVDPADIAFDYGVTEDTIRIGLNADLSGAFAPLVTQIVDGQEVFWEMVNDQGGIAGRKIELVVLDNAYDVPTHMANYEEMADESDNGVIMFSQSTGSPHTAATAEALVEDNLLAIPLSWYSGYADPDIGLNVMELYTNYCVEAMNAIEYLTGVHDAKTLGIVSFPGDYGEDGAMGAKIAAEALGLEIVYDGTGAVAPGADVTPVITELVAAQPDIVWATLNPTTFASVFGGAVQQGLQAQWSGNSPNYNYQLLGTELAAALDSFYTHSTYTQLWGVPGEGMDQMIEAMRTYRPDAPLSDVYIVSWTEGLATKAVLEKAAELGDMTRAGVVAAFQQTEADFLGLAPPQRWFGDPNDFIVRESYLYDVVLENFTPGVTVSDEGGTGFELLEGPYVGSIAASWDYEPCYLPGG